MAEVITLAAEPRPAIGTGAARAVRAAGKVPGVLYGGGEGVTHLSFTRDDIEREIKRRGFLQHLCDIKVNGKTERALPREVQFHPVTDAPVHVDFQRVTAHSRIRVQVGVRFINEAASPGIKRGGVLNAVRREIEVMCPADAIPEAIVVDLAGLDIGTSIHISHVTLPEGVRPTITDRDFTVATIAPPTVQAVETVAKPAEGEGAAEEVAAAEAPAGDAKKPAAETKKPAGDVKKS